MKQQKTIVKNKKAIVISLLCAVLLLFCLYLSLFCGYRDNGLEFIKNIHSDENSLIFELLRSPRALKAVVAGSCLALAGLFMQAITKNPLAEPYITGISSGAGLAIVLSILFFGGSNYSLWGFLGAFLSSLLVILFAGLNKFSLTKLILVGLSVNIFVSSLISLLILTNGEKAYPLMLILSGGLTNNTIISNTALFGLFLLAMLVCIFVIPRLNFLRLDKDMVMGEVNKREFYIFFVIILSSFLTSLSVFAAGIIGFVGIIIPQISKMLVGQDFRRLFIINVLLGSSLMLVCDYLSRVLLYPVEIPLGLVIALLGAPVFVFFLVKSKIDRESQ